MDVVEGHIHVPNRLGLAPRLRPTKVNFAIQFNTINLDKVNPIKINNKVNFAFNLQSQFRVGSVSASRNVALSLVILFLAVEGHIHVPNRLGLAPRLSVQLTI